MTDPNPNAVVDPTKDPTNAEDGGKGNQPVDPKNNPPVDPKDPEDPKDPKEDYKTKFQESSSEANRLRDIAIANGIDPKTGLPVKKVEDEPQGVRNDVNVESNRSDEELGKDIPGFEFLSDEEKATVLGAKKKGNQIDVLTSMVAKLIDKDKFGQQLAQLVAQPEFTSLAGDSAFKAFAYKKENLQTSLEVLARSYLYKKPAESEPTDPGDGNRPGLEDGGGHSPTPPSNKDAITTEQIAHIRVNDPKRYMKLIKEGKIRNNLK